MNMKQITLFALILCLALAALPVCASAADVPALGALFDRFAPLLGDGLYGAKCPDKGLEGQCLHARQLRLIHPRSGEELKLASPLPDYFLDVLSRLGPEI